MLLFYLVQNLSDTETQSLNHLDLTAGEGKLLHYCINVKHIKSFPSGAAQKKLHFSESNLHKLSSITLNKVLAHLYTPDFNLQLASLAKKIRLVPVIRHLMKKRERQLLKLKLIGTLSAFYQTCFEIEAGHYASDFDAGIMEYYHRQCLKYAGKTVAAQLALSQKLQIYNGAINRDGSLGMLTNAKVVMQHDKNLQMIQDTALALKSDPNYCKSMVIRARLRLDADQAEEAIAILKADIMSGKRIIKISPSLKMEMQVVYCKALYFSSRFSESFAAFSLLDMPQCLPVNGMLPSDVAKYFQVALITGHYECAAELLDKFFSKFYDAGNSASVMARIQLAKYLIYTGSYSKAIALIAQVTQPAKTLKLLQYEIELRILHAIALLFANDKYSAFNSAERSLKLLYSKNQVEKLKDFIEAFQLIKALCKRVSLNKNQQMILDKYQASAYMQYGALFNRLLMS